MLSRLRLRLRPACYLASIQYEQLLVDDIHVYVGVYIDIYIPIHIYEDTLYVYITWHYAYDGIAFANAGAIKTQCNARSTRPRVSSLAMAIYK